MGVETAAAIRSVSYPAVVVCVGCGWFGVGIVEGESIIPTGVDRCPDCGGSEWRELVDGHDRWPAEE